jgi:hypothetical protein
MAKFVNNNATFFETSMTPFFANKSFHSRMFFSSNNIVYTIARERIDVARTKNIIDTMQNILEIMKNNFKRTQKTISRQANKRRKTIKY